MVYYTGDIHGNTKELIDFANRFKLTEADILIIVGDVGANYYGNHRDRYCKETLASMKPTIFCIHGNHEQRPYTISSYKEKEWHEGIVYYEEEFPSILFAKDGEIFDLDGKKTIVLGGAYSIDKYFRLLRGYPWWSDEQPSMEIKQYAEQRLEEHNWKIDIVLSHTGPLKFEPREMFLEGIDQSRVDKSTEIWLDYIENKLSYKKWYFGHYHTEKKIDKVEIKFNDISLFEI